ncbi:hypothetical protein SNOG_09954 [Parastagonospora nodorum SN15]|uniref:Uncharacterized protein n=1 Tax=Phaeosphaeria nodorum (strain SN15 / ATCC MYA-4574 / FGSC 10173) TaxID=321614 RepID=Q0UE60_PHANO|nr:hypothetical protein SNOG_09954 [Parastagonospora nodorum SN15]EAT82289.1 hypothetical protein SNOG_09954 [Parastagonospora nodorum SN15]
MDIQGVLFGASLVLRWPVRAGSGSGRHISREAPRPQAPLALEES